VAPLCDFDVPPPCGSDANHDGRTEDKPFATLHKARDTLRLALNSEAAKSVQIAQGIYRLAAPLELTAADSHTVWAGLDEGLLSFCLPHSRLYGSSLREEHIVVTNDSAPSSYRPRRPARTSPCPVGAPKPSTTQLNANCSEASSR
jgi:hypothetical protein